MGVRFVSDFTFNFVFGTCVSKENRDTHAEYIKIGFRKSSFSLSFTGEAIANLILKEYHRT
jgi:hypothetical protein